MNVYEEMRNFGMPEEIVQKAQRRELHMVRSLSNAHGEIAQREAQKVELLNFIGTVVMTGKDATQKLSLLEKHGRMK